MSIAAAPISETALAETSGSPGNAKTPPKRKVTAKPDDQNIPELR